MCDDRTSEFQACVRGIPGGSSHNPFGGEGIGAGRYGPPSSHNSSSSSSNNTHPNDPQNELRTFHKTAGEISRDIGATSAMLQELAQLVRHKSIFVDDSSRVNALVFTIKSSVQNLNGRLDDAATVIAKQKRRLGKNSQAGQEASNLVGQLQEEFVQATSGFKKVLQQRTDGMKATKDMKRAVYAAPGDQSDPEGVVNLGNKPAVYSSSNGMLGGGLGGGGAGLAGGLGPHGFPTIDLTSGMSTGESTSSSGQLPRPRKCNQSGSSPGSPSGLRFRGGTPQKKRSPYLDGATGLDQYSSPTGLHQRKAGNDSMPSYSGSYSSMGAASPLTPLDIQRMEEESGQSQLMQLIPDQDYLRERADAMTQVEANIVELGTIFNKLAVMVSEHREMVQRVEDNVEDANTNLNLSMNVLTDTLTNLQTNRALFFKILGVLMAFIFLFVVFLA